MISLKVIPNQQSRLPALQVGGSIFSVAVTAGFRPRMFSEFDWMCDSNQWSCLVLSGPNWHILQTGRPLLHVLHVRPKAHLLILWPPVTHSTSWLRREIAWAGPWQMNFDKNQSEDSVPGYLTCDGIILLSSKLFKIEVLVYMGT